MLPIKKYSIYVVGILTVLLFVYLIGLPSQILGGGAQIFLNNFGEDYDKLYVHKEELKSAEWIKNNTFLDRIIIADNEANLRFFRTQITFANHNILPQLIYKDAYVYGSFSNIVNGRSSIHTIDKVLWFNFPIDFLNINKNTIYNNGSSKIYR